MSLALTKIDNFVVLAKAWGMRALAWNPLTGCTGEDCAIGPKNCWAARRQKSFTPTYWPKRAEKILHVRKPSIIVCNYLGEIFPGCQFRQIERGSAAIKNEDAIAQLIDFMRQAPQHTYFWLSKHPEQYDKFDWPDGTWLGTTCNTSDDLGRLEILMKFVKAHNLKGDVYLEPLMGKWSWGNFARIFELTPDWLIGGGWSQGHGEVEIISMERLYMEWASSIISFPVFVKDNMPPNPLNDEWPREVPGRGADSSRPMADSGQPKRSKR